MERLELSWRLARTGLELSGNGGQEHLRCLASMEKEGREQIVVSCQNLLWVWTCTRGLASKEKVGPATLRVLLLSVRMPKPCEFYTAALLHAGGLERYGTCG